MLNGESEKLLKRGLTEHDLEYIENAHTFIQRSLDNGHHEEASIILRDISGLRDRVTPFHPKSGFMAMLEAAHPSDPSIPEQTEIEPEEERINSGFSAMLSASSKGKKMNQETAQQASTPIKRGMGFGAMLEASRRGTFEGDEEFKSQPKTRSGYGFRAMLEGASRGNATDESVETRDDMNPIPCGLAAMLEAMSPNRTRETLSERSHIRRGMGFANMLRDAARGTE
jgi:hypothetical protein